jgi:hypothetical protein
LTDHNRVYLLTDSAKSKQDYHALMKGEEVRAGVISMDEFLQMNAKQHPELVNYMGFAQVDIEDDEASLGSASQPLYEDHLSFDEMVLGIREGKFFKGRLNISRVNIEESTVKVDGLNDDIVVIGMKN